MSQRQRVVQAGEVSARLVQRAQSADLGLVGVVDVLGTPWLPDRIRHGRREGLNGERGFASGNFEPRRDEESQLTLVMANAAGSDGRLHLERFEAITRAKGRVPEGQEYHPGDEWIELSFDREVEAVVTPLGATVNKGRIELRCADVFWQLKKFYETQAGYWTPSAPRDVWEHYCSAWQMIMAESFDRDLAYSTSEQTTSDGRLAYLRTQSWGDSRVALVGGGEYAGVRAGDDLGEFLNQEGDPDEHLPWRLDVSLIRNTLGPDDFLLVGLGEVEAPEDPDSTILRLGVRIAETTAYGYTTTVNPLNLRYDSAPGRMTITVEARDRWVFFFVDGELRGVSPHFPHSIPLVPKVVTNTTVVVEQMNFRRARSYALRGADRGDYHLPGAPPAGGFDGRYFSEADTWSLAPDGLEHVFLLRPNKEAALPRRDAVLDFYGSPVAWAGGLASQFSVRWAGAVYLDLADRDLLVRALADDRVRVWVGKTRRDEQVIDDWTQFGHALTLTYSGSLRDHLGEVSGWYPIVVEYSQDSGAGGIRLEVADAAHPTVAWLIGGGSYRLEVGADSPVALYPLGDLTTELDYGPNSLNSTARANVSRVTGPIPGHQAYEFNGSSSYVARTSAAALNPTAALTVEAWVRPDTVSGVHAIAGKDGQYRLALSGQSVRGILTTGAGSLVLDSGSVMVAGEWQHVAMAWSDTDDVVKLYRNGVEVASGTRAGPLSTSSAVFEIGRSTALGTWFDGGIAEVGLYASRLSGVRVLAHYVAQNDEGTGRVSPLGCWAEDVKGESHYETVRRLIETFGLQTRTEPRSLESGEFPGQLIPKVRVGMDTDKVITAEEATEVQTEISAEETADLITADAAGLAKEGAQLVVEELDFERVFEHQFLSMASEPLSEMTVEANVRQRLASLLTLRAAPAEEVGARPASKRDVVKPFLLSEESASELRYRPGDGARLSLPVIGVEDETPRQMMGIGWPFVQTGYGLPTVSWRQRPRNFKETLRRLQRRLLAPQRTYQGQLMKSSGNPGRTPAPSAAGAITDNYSRVSLPTNAGRVVEATFVVQAKQDGSSMNIEVDGTNRLTFTEPGRYDITPWVPLSGQRLFARATGGSGYAEYAVELLIAL